MMVMDDFTQKLLDFLVTYTWHVMDENGAPAKLPHTILYSYDKDQEKTNKALEFLREKKYIIGYSFSNQKIGLRATALGNAVSKIAYNRRDIKRWLIIKGNKLTLMNHEDYINSRDDMSFIGEGEKTVGDMERHTPSIKKGLQPLPTNSKPSSKNKKNMEDWL